MTPYGVAALRDALDEVDERYPDAELEKSPMGDLVIWDGDDYVGVLMLGGAGPECMFWDLGTGDFNEQ